MRNFLSGAADPHAPRTAAQRAHRLRQLAASRAAIAAKLRAIDAEARALENEHSWSLGFNVPLRGDRLLQEMDRRDGLGRDAQAVR